MEFKLATHRSNEMKPEVIKMLPKNYFQRNGELCKHALKEFFPYFYNTHLYRTLDGSWIDRQK